MSAKTAAKTEAKPAAEDTPIVVDREMSLTQLRTSEKPLFATNNTPGLITCTPEGTKISFILQPKGQPGSIALLPKEVIGEPGFQRMWAQKKVLITDDERVEDQITLQTLDIAKIEQSRLDKLAEVTEVNRTDKDIIVKKCLISGEPVNQTVAQVKAGVPPLAERFADQSARFVPTMVSGPNGPEYQFQKIAN